MPFPPETRARARRETPATDQAGYQSPASAVGAALETGGNLASILTKLTTIDGRVDGLEALIGSTNTKLDTLAAYLAGYSFAHIATSTTTVVKSGAGVLHGVTINTKGTIASTITIYDNTAGSGTVIAIIDSLNLSGSFFYDAIFATGLTLVTTGAVAPDVSVFYR